MRASPFVLAVAAVATTGFAPAAWAHVQPTAPARHCVVWIAPTTGRAPSKVSRMHCFRRFSRAVHVARGRPPKGFRTGAGFVERDVTVPPDEAYAYAVRDLVARTLSPDERAVIVLFHLHGFRADEIADISGKSHDAVRKQLERARGKLARAHSASMRPGMG